MTRALGSGLFLSIALCWPANALAEPKSDTEAARAAYAAGKAHYEAKDYTAAISDFEQSYALSRSTALLFDIAQAHRLAGQGHCAASRRYYRSYLELEPEAENEREVAERLGEIKDCADAEEQASALTTAPATAAPHLEPPSSSKAGPAAPPARHGAASNLGTLQAALPHGASVRGSTPTVAVLTTGVGAALLLSGAVLYLRARQRYDEVKASCPCREGSFSDWQKLTNLSYGLMAVGVAGVGLGGAYWALSVSQGRGQGTSALLLGEGRF